MTTVSTNYHNRTPVADVRGLEVESYPCERAMLYDYPAGGGKKTPHLSSAAEREFLTRVASGEEPVPRRTDALPVGVSRQLVVAAAKVLPDYPGYDDEPVLLPCRPHWRFRVVRVSREGSPETVFQPDKKYSRQAPAHRAGERYLKRFKFTGSWNPAGEK